MGKPAGVVAALKLVSTRVMLQPRVTDDKQLYASWRIPGSYFNRMLDCGDRYNPSVQIALEYLPREILDEHKDRLAFVGMGQRDGCRLSRALCETREIVVLAERVFPRAGADEGQPEFRYFVYVVLHEVAHAIKRHRSPLYDSLTPQQNADQEAEADDLAFKWFNEHIEALANASLPQLSRQEIEVAKARSRECMEDRYNG